MMCPRFRGHEGLLTVLTAALVTAAAAPRSRVIVDDQGVTIVGEQPAKFLARCFRSGI